MGVDDAVKAAEMVQAKVTIPMHYDTFEPIRADARDFVAKVGRLGLKAVIVEPGGTYEL
jgi:L-ascorbate metabolism protein UlaG (beta-lactamase superfamily)